MHSPIKQMLLWLVIVSVSAVSRAQEPAIKDISTVLPQPKLSGDVSLPPGIYSGELRITSGPVRLSAKSLGNFILRGRIIIEEGSNVVLENIVVDGSRPGFLGAPAQLVEIRNSNNVDLSDCSLFAFDQPFNPSKPQTPSICEEPFWSASGIRIDNSRNVLLNGVRVATQNSRITVLNSKQVKVTNSDFCVPTAIGSQYKLYLRSSVVYNWSESDEFTNVSNLSLENDVFRATSRSHSILSSLLK